MHPALRTTSGNCRVNQACQNCWRNHPEEPVPPMQMILWFIWQNSCCLPSRSLVASADSKTRRPELIGCCAWCFAIGWAWLLSPVAVSCLSFSQTPPIVIPLSSTLGLVALSASLSLSSLVPPSSPKHLLVLLRPTHVQHCASSTNPSRPSTPHPILTRFGRVGPLSGHCTLSTCLSRIFLHQGPRQKPHTCSAVALEEKCLWSFCQWHTLPVHPGWRLGQSLNQRLPLEKQGAEAYQIS